MGKKFYYSWLILLMYTLIITGCANFPSGEPSFELGNEVNGVVAASSTYTDGTQTTNAWFYIRKEGETDDDNYIRMAAYQPRFDNTDWADSDNIAPDFPDTPNRSGRIWAISLAPGRYELYTWTLFISVFNGYGYITPKIPPKPLPFVVTAGQITYLGNLHGETLMTKNVFNLDIPGGGIPVITDKFERDLPLLKSRFPMLQNWPINNAQLNGTVWQ